MPNLAQTIRESGLPIAGGLIFAIAAVALSAVLVRRARFWLWGVNLLAFVAFVIFAVQPAAFLMDSQRQMPLRQLAGAAAASAQPGEELVMIGFEKPSLVFYTQKPVTYFRQVKLAIAHVKDIADSQPNPPSILLLGYPSKFDDAGLKPNDYKILSKSGAYQLARVSKQVLARLYRPNS